MYSSIADLKKLMPEAQLMELADDGVDSPSPQEVMNEAIEQADREIDGYLNAVLPVPMDPVPPLVANISAKIAVWNLYRRRTHLDPGSWGEEYPRQLRLLEKIAEGKISLGVTGAGESGEPAPPTEPGRAEVRTRPPEFPDRIWREY